MAYLSNIEKILANWLGAGVTEDTPHSRVEDLLIQVRNASSGATHYEVVTELPTTNIQTNVMYFVPKSEPEGMELTKTDILEFGTNMEKMMNYV